MKRKLVFEDKHGDIWDFDSSDVTVTRRRDNEKLTYGDMFDLYAIIEWDNDRNYLKGWYED